MKKTIIKILAPVWCCTLLLCSCGTANQSDTDATTTVIAPDTVTTTVSGDADSGVTEEVGNSNGTTGTAGNNSGSNTTNGGNAGGNVSSSTTTAVSVTKETWPSACTSSHKFEAELQVAKALKSGTAGARDAVYYKSCSKCGTPSTSQNDLFVPYVIKLDLSALSKQKDCFSIVNLVRGSYKGKTITFSFNYYYDVPNGTDAFTISLRSDYLQHVAAAPVDKVRQNATATITATMPEKELYVQIGGDGANGTKKLPTVNGYLYIWDLQVHVDGALTNRFDIDKDAYTASVKNGFSSDVGWFRGTISGTALEPCGDFFSAPPRVMNGSGKVTAPDSCQFLLMSDIHVEDDFRDALNPSSTADIYSCWSPKFQALTTTYNYINKNFKNLDFALFTGDVLNEGMARYPNSYHTQVDNYWNTLATLDVYKNTAGKDLSSFKFVRSADTTNYGPKELHSAVITMQGNHDHDAYDFYRDCSFIANKVKFVTFYATYKGTANGSTGVISDASVKFVEQEFAKAAGEGIEHLVLVCHFPIYEGGSSMADGFGPHSILDKADGNDNDNRQKILDLCEKYGCMLYLSGHAHGSYAVGTALNSDGSKTNVKNVSLGSATSSWSIAEIKNNQLTLQVYSTAVADFFSGEITDQPTYQKTVTVDLIPRSQLVSKG